jgi:hypothetical protein
VRARRLEISVTKLLYPQPPAAVQLVLTGTVEQLSADEHVALVAAAAVIEVTALAVELVAAAVVAAVTALAAELVAAPVASEDAASDVAEAASEVAEVASEDAASVVAEVAEAAVAPLARSLRSSRRCAPASASRPGTSLDPDSSWPQSMAAWSDLLRRASWFESYFSPHSRK